MSIQGDAIVVGSGPNGLAAAITLARHHQAVVLLEANEKIGGGTRSAELTLPGYIHDVCSGVHPLGVASPFFASLPLGQYGLEWVHPDASFAHPLDDGTAVVVERSVEATARGLGTDANTYFRIMSPLVSGWSKLREDILGPPPYPPRHPSLYARFGWLAIRPAYRFIKSRFKGERGRALLGGLAAHSCLPLEEWVTTGFALGLGVTAHWAGWPVARGGSQKIADALGAIFLISGGKIITGRLVKSMEDLPPARQIFFDLTPRQLVNLEGGPFKGTYRRQLEAYRYGPGVFKVDMAIDGQIPWTARECQRTVTYHLGGSIDEIAACERAAWRGEISDDPFVILSEPSRIDPTRAPPGKNTVWAYCHVPHGSKEDMTGRIIAQVERFAPGFTNHILAIHKTNPEAMEASNPNQVGGDINGGVQDIRQLYTRPARRLNPYSTPLKGVFLCSSATPPGGGVHGMCGVNAAQAALRSI